MSYEDSLTILRLFKCLYQGKCAVKYLCVGVIDSASGYDFAILIWNCSDSVLFCLFFMSYTYWGRRGRDHMVGGFKSSRAISFEFEPRSW